MSVRKLTASEILNLDNGTECVLLVDCDELFLDKGATLVRRDGACDDIASSAFTYTNKHGEGSYEYFEEGEVGIVEVQASTNTVCAGRTCVDFSGHLVEPQYAVEHLVTGQPEHEIKVDLGMYRPELGTRKIGKIRVELVDHGFPRALREVAKVMTWAQDAKGYKDHDWQNLPNAEVALEAAASRHRTDHIEQRVVEGYTIERCVDHESGLLHKAHEAFGVLAQLELMLRGEFDRGVDLTH